jgi:DNA-binding IclR family transcriptional regulator
MSEPSLSSVANAVRVLRAFSSARREWGVTDLARHLDLSKSTVHRLLNTLTAEGMLDQDPHSGLYRLGLVVFDLAAAVPTQLDLHEAVLLPMTELRNRTGATTQIGVLDGREVVYVERLDSPDTVRTFQDVGRRNFAHCSANGKALLAFTPRRQVERLLRDWDLPARTDHTITDRIALDAELETIRHRGYAVNDEEARIGVSSVAAPIRDGGARLAASISVVGPAERIRAAQTELADAVMHAAAVVSRRLGYRVAA